MVNQLNRNELIILNEIVRSILRKFIGNETGNKTYIKDLKKILVKLGDQSTQKILNKK